MICDIGNVNRANIKIQKIHVKITGTTHHQPNSFDKDKNLFCFLPSTKNRMNYFCRMMNQIQLYYLRQHNSVPKPENFSRVFFSQKL